MRTVQQILEDAGYETRAYSGRGMGGKECLSVEMDGVYPVGKFFADVLDVIEPDEIGEMASTFRGMREDSMGLGTVIYFPRLDFEA